MLGGGKGIPVPLQNRAEKLRSPSLWIASACEHIRSQSDSQREGESKEDPKKLAGNRDLLHGS